MIGTSPQAQGGVAAVVRALIAGGLSDLYVIDYLETHCDGGALAKVQIAAYAFFRFVYRLVTGKVAILHVHVASRASFLRKCLLILPAYAFRKPVVLHLHGAEFHLFYENECPPPVKRLVRYVFENAAGVVVLSAGWKKWIEGSFPRAKVRVIYNPAPAVGSIEIIGRDEVALLFLGKLGDRKGTGDLVQAVAKLAPSFGNVRLLLGGDGDLAGTRKLAERLGIGQYVETLGWVASDRKRELLDQCAVFVLPSYNEGLPMGVLEAMAHGLPVVSTPVGGIPEAITDGVEGFLVQPGDIDALADRLGRLLKDPALRQAMSEAAKRKVESTFALDRIIPQWVELYAEQGIAPSPSLGG
jgi:glycosyltransferase involved in cell wall biosynthesis